MGNSSEANEGCISHRDALNEEAEAVLVNVWG